MSFKFILARVNKVSMAINNCLLSFDRMIADCHVLLHSVYSMGMNFFPSFFSNFTKKRVFQFLIATPGVKLCWDKQKLSQLSKSVSKTLDLSTHCSKPEGVIKNWIILFCSKIIKEAWEKNHAHAFNKR